MDASPPTLAVVRLACHRSPAERMASGVCSPTTMAIAVCSALFNSQAFTALSSENRHAALQELAHLYDCDSHLHLCWSTFFLLTRSLPTLPQGMGLSHTLASALRYATAPPCLARALQHGLRSPQWRHAHASATTGWTSCSCCPRRWALAVDRCQSLCSSRCTCSPTCRPPTSPRPLASVGSGII